MKFLLRSLYDELTGPMPIVVAVVVDAVVGTVVRVGNPPLFTVTIIVRSTGGTSGVWSLFASSTEKVCVPGLKFCQV